MVEIKSTLTKQELVDSHRKIVQYKELFSDDPGVFAFGDERLMGRGAVYSANVPFGIIFAYDADSSLEKIADNLFELEKALSPRLCCNLIVVLSKGLVLRTYENRPYLNWGFQMTTPFPRDLLVAQNLGRTTLGEFYPLLINLLRSVHTYPVNPSLYRNVSKHVDGAIITGQIRVIDTVAQTIREISSSFLKQLVAAWGECPLMQITDVENDIRSSGIELRSVGVGTVKLYDPEQRLAADFKALSEARMENLNLFSGCTFIAINDTLGIIPNSYITGTNVDVSPF